MLMLNIEHKGEEESEKGVQPFEPFFATGGSEKVFICSILNVY